MNCKVLIIDDAVPIHTLVKANLSQQRFEVLSTFDGSAGLAAASAWKPDLILLDVDMPNIHGYEVCRRLKADRATRHIPVLFLTAASTSDQKIRGLDLGACDYITKPFDAAELRARMRVALRTREAADAIASNAMADDLTGLFDRRYFDARLDAEMAMAWRTGRPLGCILIDIDHMSSVNGAFGHEMGDSVLRAVGQSLLDTSRREDVVCRYEGDAYAVLASGTDGRVLNELAERLRQAVHSPAVIAGDKAIQVTASVGVAISRLAVGTSIVGETEEALRRAKEAGGNCVRSSHEVAALRMAV